MLILNLISNVHQVDTSWPTWTCWSSKKLTGAMEPVEDGQSQRLEVCVFVYLCNRVSAWRGSVKLETWLASNCMIRRPWGHWSWQWKSLRMDSGIFARKGWEKYNFYLTNQIIRKSKLEKYVSDAGHWDCDRWVDWSSRLLLWLSGGGIRIGEIIWSNGILMFSRSLIITQGEAWRQQGRPVGE